MERCIQVGHKHNLKFTYLTVSTTLLRFDKAVSTTPLSHVLAVLHRAFGDFKGDNLGYFAAFDGKIFVGVNQRPRVRRLMENNNRVKNFEKLSLYGITAHVQISKKKCESKNSKEAAIFAGLL